MTRRANRSIPDFSDVGILFTSTAVGVDIGQVVFELDSSEDADDWPRADEVHAAVVIGSDHKIRIIVAVQIHSAAQ